MVHFSMSRFRQTVYDTEGNPIALTSTSTDITERNKAEERLKRSEEQFHAIFDHVENAIVIVDTDTGKIIDFNTKTHEGLGYTRKEFSKLSIADFSIVELNDEKWRGKDNTLA